MFGAGIPVCAVKYEPALSELVQNGVNGRVFVDSKDLSTLMLELLFEENWSAVGGKTLMALKTSNLKHLCYWEQNWIENMTPLVNAMFESSGGRNRGIFLLAIMVIICAMGLSLLL